MSPLPHELWGRILTFLSLYDLWYHARPVCILWESIANDVARLRLHKGSEIEISTLVNEMGGFQHYEGDTLYPLIPNSDIDAFAPSSALKLLRNSSAGRRLIWLKEGVTIHEWTDFRSPENMWPNVIKYKSRRNWKFRLDYDFEFVPLEGGDTCFIRQTESVPPTHNRADWRVRVKANHNGDESIAAVSIPFWQLVQLCFKGSVYSQDVEELHLGAADTAYDGHSYYVWSTE